MTYKLYLDDERTPKTSGMADAVVVRSFAEAVQYVLDHGAPSHISFDHDLGTEASGCDFARWLVEHDLDNEGMFLPGDFTFNVHSANPVGSENIDGLLGSYLEFRSKE